MTDTALHYIAGKQTKGASTRMQDIYNPALGEKKGEVVMGTAQDVDCLLYTSPSPRDA